MNTLFFSRQQYWLALIFGCLLVFLAASLGHGQWLDYAQRVATLDEPLSRLRWIVGDISEVAFYKHELPALGLLLGACLAHWAQLRGYRWQGFAICYGSGLWPWVFTSSLLGLLLSHVLWGWTLASGTWQPTFVAFVSLPAAMVLLFGAGWRVTITGALLGALLVTPAGLLMQTFVHEAGRLPAHIAAELGSYRYRVFVEQLGWQLPSEDEKFERDQYDRDDTVYVLGRDANGEICGCARLLPTTRPYLLQEVFPHLLADEHPAPRSAHVWELSRFAATPEEGADAGSLAWSVRPMLAAAVECAARRGARQLIGVTFCSIERLFRRIGVHAHRAGAPVSIDGRMVVACWIDIDAQTLAALDLDPALCASQPEAA
ncbi:acyl-homoserine-lactone synthase [Pseudomonas sp. LFS022]